MNETMTRKNIEVNKKENNKCYFMFLFFSFDKLVRVVVAVHFDFHCLLFFILLFLRHNILYWQ